MRRIDVAELNGRIFVNNSAIGLYPLMVVDRDAQQKRLGRSKRLAMLVASARTLARFHHHRLTLTVNGNDKRWSKPLCCSSATMTTSSPCPPPDAARSSTMAIFRCWSCPARGAPG